MGRIIDTTKSLSSYNLISQTPPNLSKDNYFLRTLQDKVNADWKYRYNVVVIEQEEAIGSANYFPIEVVIQSVRNDKGTKVSDDIRRLVFKDIHYSVRLGTKFRFSYDFDQNLPEEKKNVWLATNKDSTSPTAQVVISRCNGTLGSIYTDSQGNSQYHYEPAICADTLTAVSLNYNSVIVTPQAQITITVQHNEFTKNYYINQRFIIGYDRVYKIKAINKANSLQTYNPEDVGLVILYAELDEISAKDNFDTRIAYNDASTPPVVEESTDNYYVSLYSPTPLPQDLIKTPMVFKAGLFNEGNMLDTVVNISVDLPGVADQSLYYEFSDLGNNSFSLTKKQTYNRGVVVVTCTVPSASSPTQEDITAVYNFGLKGVY